MVGRAGWDRGRGRERAGSSAGREAVLERRTREVGRRTALLEGEQKGFPLLPATESSLNPYQGREGTGVSHVYETRLRNHKNGVAQHIFPMLAIHSRLINLRVFWTKSLHTSTS